MKTLYLIRHGKTEFNLNRRMQGFMDSPLLAESKQMARDLGHAFKEKKIVIDRVYASPLGRVQSSLAYFLEGYGQRPDVVVDDKLKEMHFGQSEGQSVDETFGYVREALDLSLEDLKALSQMDKCDLIHRLERFNQAEAIVDVKNRAKSIRDRILKEPGESIVVFGHGIILACLLSLCDNLSEVSVALKNLSVTEVSLDQKSFRCEKINQVFVQ